MYYKILHFSVLHAFVNISVLRFQVSTIHNKLHGNILRFFSSLVWDLYAWRYLRMMIAWFNFIFRLVLVIGNLLNYFLQAVHPKWNMVHDRKVSTLMNRCWLRKKNANILENYRINKFLQFLIIIMKKLCSYPRTTNKGCTTFIQSFGNFTLGFLSVFLLPSCRRKKNYTDRKCIKSVKSCLFSGACFVTLFPSDASQVSNAYIFCWKRKNPIIINPMFSLCLRTYVWMLRNEYFKLMIFIIKNEKR